MQEVREGMAVNEREQVGMMVAGMGIFYVLFGVSMMFDRSLLACGNLMFVAGIAIAIGPRKATEFFFNKSNVKGTIFLVGGVILVLVQWPLFGILAESIGFIMLFRSIPFLFTYKH